MAERDMSASSISVTCDSSDTNRLPPRAAHIDRKPVKRLKVNSDTKLYCNVYGYLGYRDLTTSQKIASNEEKQTVGYTGRFLTQ